MKTVMEKCDQQKFNILLTHNPVYLDSYTKWGVDLIFSGHLHGGMIRIPFIGGLLSPERVFFPKYDAGKFVAEDTTMIVSRGLGNGNVGYRLFNCPEIVVVTLHSN